MELILSHLCDTRAGMGKSGLCWGPPRVQLFQPWNDLTRRQLYSLAPKDGKIEGLQRPVPCLSGPDWTPAYTRSFLLFRPVTVQSEQASPRRLAFASLSTSCPHL